jgi:hypothetical protein
VVAPAPAQVVSSVVELAQALAAAAQEAAVAVWSELAQERALVVMLRAQGRAGL